MTTPMNRAANFFAYLRGLRSDGWSNALTGLGTDRDKTTAARFQRSAWEFDYELFTALWEGDPIFGKIANVLPSEAMRAGYTLQGATPEDLKRVEEEAALIGSEDPENPRVDAAILHAWQLSRALGGSAILIRTEGEIVGEPLAGRVVGLTVLDRQEIMPEWATDPTLINRMRRTDYYMTAGVRVHASRVIPFYGEPTTRSGRVARGGWGLSYFSKPYRIVELYMQGLGGAGHLLTDAGQAVWKIGGLWRMAAQDDPESENAIRTRIQLFETLRSSIRAIIVDKDTEDFTRVPTPMSEVPQTLQELKSAVAMAAAMPETKLWGRSPAGMNATGESDHAEWRGAVDHVRTTEIGPRILRLYSAIAAGVGAAPPEAIEWGPLSSPTPKEAAEVEKLRAEAATAAIDAGILSVAEGRAAFAGGGSVFGSIDPKLAAEELEAERRGPSFDKPEGEPEDDKPEGEPEDDKPEAPSVVAIPLTPTDVAEVVRVDEARASLGLPPIGAEEGSAFIGAFKVRQQAATNAAVAAEFPSLSVSTETTAAPPKGSSPEGT
jgi:phage-related protein (TIGR01555 family)